MQAGDGARKLTPVMIPGECELGGGGPDYPVNGLDVHGLTGLFDGPPSPAPGSFQALADFHLPISNWFNTGEEVVSLSESAASSANDAPAEKSVSEQVQEFARGMNSDDYPSIPPGDELGSGVERVLMFSQTTAKPEFSVGGTFEGLTISDVAAKLRAGELKPTDVPVNIVVMDGNNLIVNTRSSLALKQAGIPQRDWVINDVTSNPKEFANIADRLVRNKLTTAGTPVLRITGSGTKASTYVGTGPVPR